MLSLNDIFDDLINMIRVFRVANKDTRKFIDITIELVDQEKMPDLKYGFWVGMV